MTDKTSPNRKDGSYELPDIKEIISCPDCDEGTITLKRTIYRLPDGEDIIIVNMECPKCGFHKNDLVPLYSAFKPGEFHLTVDDGDFTHKIFRGTSGDIDIPEIGMSIEHGPAGQYCITNVEGILISMQENLEFFLRTTKKDSKEWKNAMDVKEKLLTGLNGKLSFTLILRDEFGGSYISASNKSKLNFIPYSQK